MLSYPQEALNACTPGDIQFSSVQFCRSVVSNSLWPHESQAHTRPPCPSPTPGVYSNSCPANRWCHPAISSSVVPFSSCPQSLLASRSFPMSQLFASGGQSTGVSASTSVLPINTQDWSPLGWTGWISLQSNGLWRVFSNTIVQKHQFFGAQLSSQSNSHIHTWPLEKTIALPRRTFVGKVMSLLFNMLSRLVITFLPRSKHLLISWVQSPSAVINWSPPKIKSDPVSTVSPSVSHEVMGPDAMILVFWMLSFKPTFSTLLFHFHQDISPSLILDEGGYSFLWASSQWKQDSRGWWLKGWPEAWLWNRSSESTALPQPLCVTLPGFPENSCPRWLHLWALTQPTQPKLFPHIFSPGVPCPSFLSEHSHHPSSSTHHWSLPSPTDLSLVSLAFCRKLPACFQHD